MDPHKHRHFFIFFLVVVAIGGGLLGIYTIYQTLYSPFKTDGPVLSISEIEKTQQLGSIQYILSLQTLDTDTDGISDYDEIYTYNTSPYLKDTDSDGAEDRAELEAGDDPLCHKDKDCSGGELVETEPFDDLFLPPRVQQPTTDGGGLPTDDIDPQSLTGSDLRDLLGRTGFPQDQLQAFSDEQLQETWQRILGGQ